MRCIEFFSVFTDRSLSGEFMQPYVLDVNWISGGMIAKMARNCSQFLRKEEHQEPIIPCKLKHLYDAPSAF